MAKFLVNEFTAGLRYDLRDVSKKPDNSYPFGSNIRVRTNTVVPVADPLDVTDPRWFRVQGHMGMGRYHVVIADGFAYVRDTSDEDGTYHLLSGYSLSTTATRVWMEVVGVSTNTFVRTLTSTDRAAGVTLLSSIPQLANGFYSDQGGGIPCMVIQDGTNQPMLIHPQATVSSFTCRPARSYEDWTPEDPEYVPIGYQMLYVGNILYIAGKSDNAFEDKRVIFRSVTGRALDFMVNIRQDGSKEPRKADGEARTVAHAVDFDEITALARIPSDSTNFLVCTDKQSWVVQPTRTTTIFGEPTFLTDYYVGPLGAVDDDSVININGRIAIVSSAGIRSFDATAQVKRESSNDVFSGPVHDLLEGISQTTVATIEDGDYVLFGLNTVYGPAMLVYDTVLSRYVSLDLHESYNNVGKFGVQPTTVNLIRQFAKTKYPGQEWIFMLVGNKIMKLYGGSTYNPKIYVGDFCLGDTEKLIAGDDSMVVLTNNPSLTEVTMDVVVDGVYQNTHRRNSLATAPAQTYRTIPLGQATVQSYSFSGFNLRNRCKGNKVGFLVSWNTAAELSTFQFTYTETKSNPQQESYNRQ